MSKIISMGNEAITAYSTLGLAILSMVSVWIAYCAIKKQNEQVKKSNENFKLSLGIDIIAKLDANFNSTDFRKMRLDAAQSLLNGIKIENAEDVFDFFETLGLLVRLGALNDEVVHNFFFHWINLYWVAGKDYISSKQQDTKAVWQDFESLYQKIIEVEKEKDSNSADLYLGGDRLKDQLKEEIITED
jgi:hypothetical protein